MGKSYEVDPGEAVKTPRPDSLEIELLLRQLRSTDTQAAWEDFLREYSSVLYQTVWKFTQNEDEAADCFVYVCEQLAKNAFRRLLQFKTDGAASFRTWLRVVARNLSFDWHRKNHGRIRPFKSMLGLAPLELEAYRLRYEHGLSRDEALQRLRATWPAANMEVLTDIESRLENYLSSRQHWLLCAWKQREFRTLISDTEEETWARAAAVIDTGPDPEAMAVSRQQQARLQKAVRLLSPIERLVVHLRFEDDLSLKEIAELTGFGDAQRVHRRIAAILQKLQVAMEAKNERKSGHPVRALRQESK